VTKVSSGKNVKTQPYQDQKITEMGKEQQKMHQTTKITTKTPDLAVV
jgi:hypothetical protein